MPGGIDSRTFPKRDRTGRRRRKQFAPHDVGRISKIGFALPKARQCHRSPWRRGHQFRKQAEWAAEARVYDDTGPPGQPGTLADRTLEQKPRLPDEARPQHFCIDRKPVEEEYAAVVPVSWEQRHVEQEPGVHAQRQRLRCSVDEELVAEPSHDDRSDGVLHRCRVP